MAPKWPPTDPNWRFWHELNLWLMLTTWVVGAACVALAIAFIIWFAWRVL